jgi:hypothetical protein
MTIMNKIQVYKLFKKRKDGTLGSLFINQKAKLKFDTWYEAETEHYKKGFTYRPGWHCTGEKNAPHLTERGRVWCKVEIYDYEELIRPQIQGSKWYLAKNMKIIKEV